jgi:antirestriction protein ArdC
MDKIKNSFDIYQLVTDQIIKILEEHKNLNYSSCWLPSTGEIMAYNPACHRNYNGLNIFILYYTARSRGYTQNRWMTLHQADECGAKVKKGEKSSMVTFWGRMYVDDKTRQNVTRKVKEILANGGKMPEGITVIPILKYYSVFNLEQMEAVPENLLFKGENPSYSEDDKNETAEEYILKSGARITYLADMGNCYYPTRDIIQLCPREQFKGAEAFYKTAFHELGHWTGHSSRLDRPMKHSFGSPEYAFEELIAELFSVFIAARCGFSSPITNNAAYIDSWLECLRSDKKFVLSASGKAQKAADFASSLVESFQAKEVTTC